MNKVVYHSASVQHPSKEHFGQFYCYPCEIVHCNGVRSATDRFVGACGGAYADLYTTAEIDGWCHGVGAVDPVATSTMRSPESLTDALALWRTIAYY